MNSFKPVAIMMLVLGVLSGMAVGGWWLRERAASPDAPPDDGVTAAEHALLAASELDKAKQQEIWDAEHVTFMLERRVGSVLVDAWKRRDDTRLSAFVTPEATTTVLPLDAAQVIQHGPIVEHRLVDVKETRSGDRTLLVAHLLEILKSFAAVERMGFRVLHIHRDAADANRWTAEVLLTAHGTQANGGPIAAELKNRIEVVMTDKEDLAESSLIDSWEQLTCSTRTSSEYLLQEATDSFGLRRIPLEDNWNLAPSQANRYRHQYAVADYNLDGHLDVAVATYGGEPMLLESAGGQKLEDASEKLIIRGERGGGGLSFVAAWLDYDNDGYPDLVLGGRLFHNERGRRLVDVTELSGLLIDPYSLGCTIVDYDCDGLLDIYLVFQESQNQGGTPTTKRWVNEEDSGWENQLWRNQGGGRFSNVTRFAAAGGGARHTFAAAWMFYDDDHYPDVYLANDFGKNVLLRNRGDGTFEDVSAASGAADYATSMGVAAGDIDNDGRTDIYVANMYSKMGRRIIGQVSAEDYPEGIFEQIKGACAGNSLYVRAADGHPYQEAGVRMGVNEVGWAFGPAMTDLDGDGFLDLYATTGFMSFSRTKPDG